MSGGEEGRSMYHGGLEGQDIGRADDLRMPWMPIRKEGNSCVAC